MPSHRPGSHRTAEPTEELRYVKPFPDTACVNCTGVSQTEYHTQNVCEYSRLCRLFRSVYGVRLGTLLQQQGEIKNE